jgi:hypothetical protein
MNSNKALAAIAGLAALTLGLALSSAAQANPVQVERGPNGAASVVNGNKIPLGVRVINPANIRPHAFPQLRIRGSHGAAHIVGTSSRPQPSASIPKTSEIITRGPNGAAFVVD